jgi:hypothetical protein
MVDRLPQEGSKGMQVIGRRARTRRATTTITVAGAAITALVAMVVIALPASARTSTPTSPSYRVRQILSGKSLGHWYTKDGSTERHWERLSSPDDITIFRGDLFTTFQNGVGPQGQASADGNRDSTIVEFTQGGQVIHKWDLRGKCDGLTANPATGQVIATINEDANSSLDSIDSWTGQVTHYRYSKQPLPHHGGTDAISFYDGRMLISASAPGTTGAAAPNPAYPAVYSVSLDSYNQVAYVHALFYDESTATAANGPHMGDSVRLGLTDPDSNEVVPATAPMYAGDFMLTSQGDKEQIYVHGPGTWYQHLTVLALSQSVDDTAWATSWRGTFFGASTSTDTIDAVTGTFWPGTAFVAVTPCDANGAPATCPGPGYPPNYLGQLNMYTGKITSVSLHGPSFEPQGMIFVAS